MADFLPLPEMKRLMLLTVAALCVACGSSPVSTESPGVARVVVYGRVLEGGPEGRLVTVRLWEQLPAGPPSTTPPQCQQGRTLDAAVQLLDASGAFRIELRTASGIVSGCVQVIADPKPFDAAHGQVRSGYLPVMIKAPPAAADSVAVTLTLPYFS